MPYKVWENLYSFSFFIDILCQFVYFIVESLCVESICIIDSYSLQAQDVWLHMVLFSFVSTKWGSTPLHYAENQQFLNCFINHQQLSTLKLLKFFIFPFLVSGCWIFIPNFLSVIWYVFIFILHMCCSHCQWFQSCHI